MKTTVHVHIPYPMLVERLDDVLAAGINPEVFFDSLSLDSYRPRELERIKKGLNEKGLSLTIHGPYMDLSPGAADEKIRLATAERFREVFGAASYLGPRAIVLHAGYDDRRFDGDVGLWLSQSLKTWPEFIEAAEKTSTVIAVENVFEDNPGPIERLLGELKSGSFGVCLDSGHINIFSKKAGMKSWFTGIGARIKEVHVHDNHGKRDEHLPCGEGTIDFKLFFGLLKKHANNPIYTIEPHGEEVLFRGLDAVMKFL